MKEININGKMIPLSIILDVFTEGSYFYVDVYGEPIQEIDGFAVDEIIQVAAHIVDEKIIETRKGATTFSLLLENWS